MEPFTCPVCDHQSSFDPWVAPAHCPQCGYRPPPDGPPPPEGSAGAPDWGVDWLDLHSAPREGDRVPLLRAEDLARYATVRVYRCPRCGHQDLSFPSTSGDQAGAPRVNCSRCGYAPSPDEDQGFDLLLEDLDDLYTAGGEAYDWDTLQPRLQEQALAYRRLAGAYPEGVVLRAFQCPKCGRQSAFAAGEPVRCPWCGHASRDKHAGEGQAETGAPSGRSRRTWGPRAFSPGRLLRLAFDTVHMGIRNLPSTMAFLLIGLWLMLLVYSLLGEVSRGLFDRANLLLAAKDTAPGTVVRLYTEGRAGRAPQNYYVTYQYTVAGPGGEAEAYTRSQRVTRSLYTDLETGSPVTVRYARRDPGLSNIAGNESFCPGTVCFSVVALLMIVAILYLRFR